MPMTTLTARLAAAADHLDSYGLREVADFYTHMMCLAAEKEADKPLNKPFRTPSGPKKFSVYVKGKGGNVKKVNFGDPNMEIKRDDPERRKNFRARHNCDNPGPKDKAKYWSCKMWSGRSVSDITSAADREGTRTASTEALNITPNEFLDFLPESAFWAPVAVNENHITFEVPDSIS